jgi:hypothetical protein
MCLFVVCNVCLDIVVVVFCVVCFVDVLWGVGVRDDLCIGEIQSVRAICITNRQNKGLNLSGS